MTTLTDKDDGIKGERIVCVFRKMTKPRLVTYTHLHRAQEVRIFGLPAYAYIEKSSRAIL